MPWRRGRGLAADPSDHGGEGTGGAGRMERLARSTAKRRVSDEAFGGPAAEPPVPEGSEAQERVTGELQGDSFLGLTPLSARVRAPPNASVTQTRVTVSGELCALTLTLWSLPPHLVQPTD